MANQSQKLAKDTKLSSLWWTERGNSLWNISPIVADYHNFEGLVSFTDFWILLAIKILTVIFAAL